MIAQLTLFPARRKTLPAGKIAARMIAVLARRRTWTTRKEFEAHGLNDRDCRAGCEASHGRIIFGQRGYLLMRDAKPEEIGECAAILHAQRKAAADKLRWIYRRAHGVINGTEVAK